MLQAYNCTSSPLHGKEHTLRYCSCQAPCEYIPETQPNIPQHLAIHPDRFIRYAGRMLKTFGPTVGSPAAMSALCARRLVRYLRGIRVARTLFGRHGDKEAA